MHPMCAAHAGRHKKMLTAEEAREAKHQAEYAIACEDHTAPSLRQLSR